MDKHSRVKKEATSKAAKRKENKKKPGRIFQKKSFKSVGSFVNKIIKTLGTFTNFEDAERHAVEDDDGGFRDGTPCTFSANSGNNQVAGNHSVTNKSIAQPRCSVKESIVWYYGDKIPGVLGLKNHGNTCFMNAVVQCLNNTDLLAEYLGLGRYKFDLNQRRNYGILQSDAILHARGEVTEQLASLVRALWTLEYTPQHSVEFKTIVSRYGSQFRGNSQHDALEFLLWLLDRVHEDVNLTSCRNNKTKAPEKVRGPGETENVQVMEKPDASYSFVQEHFQAQYKSSLTCPHCHKQSNTFDPFLCISLPIPLRQTRSMCVTLVFSTKGQRYLRIGLAVPLFGSLAILRRMLADEGKISPDQVILTEIYTTGFQRSFFDEDDLTCIADSDVIYAFQAPPLYIRGGSVRVSVFNHSLPSSPYSSGHEGQRLLSSGTLSSEFLNHGVPEKILLLVCNAAGTAQQAVRFGPPFLVREERSISWDQLQQSILSKLYYLMINGAQAQNARVLFKVCVVGGSVSYSYLSPQDGRPLYHPAVDRALNLCGSGGPPHVKLIIEWEHRIKDSLFGNIQEEVVKDAESVRGQQLHHIQQHSCTLDECFQLYTKEEQLAPDDAWKCPYCKQLQQGMVKMSLWTLPDILILHLKRFRQVGERRNKLATMVRFPLAGLDMGPHMVKRSQNTRLAPRGPFTPGSLDSGGKQPPPPDIGPPDFLYDLYAVCNHHGGMHGGHYTAFCRNSVDGHWYGYDDSSAEPVPEEEVCTRGAYILFYQRRNTIPPWSASSSVRGSTSSSTSDHWLVRLTRDSKTGSCVSRESTSNHTCPVPFPKSPNFPVFQDKPLKTETDGLQNKAFVRGSQGRSMSMRSPTKTKDSLTKVLPRDRSFGSKDRPKPSTPRPGELVEYLESGRRPRCTKDSIITLVATPPQGRLSEDVHGDLGGSLSGTKLGCIDTHKSGACNSKRIPEGQSRPNVERSSSLRLNIITKTRDDSSLGQRSSKRTRQDQSRTLDPQPRRGSIAGLHISHSAPPSRDSTLKRAKAPAGLASRIGGQLEVLQAGLQPEERKGMEVRSHDSVLSFFKPGFLKKDAQSTLHKGEEVHTSGPIGDSKVFNGSLSKLSISNGSLKRLALEDKRALGTAKGESCQSNGQFVNGTARNNSTATDIKRAHSSSNIQTKLDLSLGQCASLQRNGQVAPPAQRTSLTLATVKPSYATLQRTRYSTTSLGRQQRPVPESCF
ncbi:ubiquitin carboxyl-terminal hydrolase 43 isoform X3 [Esox lucius]|uniref:ubiquitin carboxyl-terminal hydrolase 43 isoform X3 n=1 Tax=Esox lucius TaxID=8010 RepID=UPI0014775EA7|nr:ubiquitin carboxyl-terminal hydrolase 43 isoform X3 [Esox lucius]